MAYLVVENFQFGLETRRSALVSKLGTLSRLENGHINQGGEVENRKLFATIDLPATCFGLEWVNTPIDGYNLVAFGSVPDPIPALTPVGYQRLQHPDGATAMTGVVHSTIFADKPFVIAQFADGYSFVYYDGALIGDFVNGLVLPYLNTNVKLANHLVAVINASGSGYTATQLAPANDFKLDLVGRYGVDYTLEIVKSSALGTLTVDANYPVDATPPVDAVAAVGRFRIIGGASGTISVEVNGVVVTNGAVTWNVNGKIQTAADVAASINTAVSAPNYTATSVEDTVIITAVTPGTGSNGFEVKVTATNSICIGKCTLRFLSYPNISLNAIYANGVKLNSGVLVYPAAYPTLAAYVTAVADNINANTSAGLTHGYVAFAETNLLHLSKAVTSSSDNEQSVEVDVNPKEAIVDGDDPTIPISDIIVVASPAGITGTKERDASNAVRTDGQVLATPNGGTPPYHYRWQAEAVGTDGGIVPIQPTDNDTEFQKARPEIGVYYHGRFVCKVTDKVGRIGYSNPVDVTIVRLKPR